MTWRGVLQKLTEDVLKPTAQEVADKLPEAAERLNDNIRSNTEDRVAQLQAQVRAALHPSRWSHALHASLAHHAFCHPTAPDHLRSTTALASTAGCSAHTVNWAFKRSMLLHRLNSHGVPRLRTSPSRRQS